MIPLRLSLQGFMSYNDEQELSFEDGSLLVLAGPNGAGKSTIFDAITYALYGQTRAERGDGVHLINHRASQLRVRFEFRVDGVEHRAERTMTRAHSRGGEEREPRKTRQAFRRADGGDWEVVPGTDKEDDFKRWLRRTLGLDYPAFTTAILLQQGQSEKLLNADPPERRELLSKLIGLSRFERLHERVDGVRLDLERQRRDLEKRLADLGEVSTEELEEAGRAVAAQEVSVAAREAALREIYGLRVHARNWEQWTEQRETLCLRQRQLEALLGRAEEIRAKSRRLEELRRVLGMLMRLVDLRDQLDALQAEGQCLGAELEQLTERRTKAEGRLAALEAEVGRLEAQREELQRQERAAANELARARVLGERWRQAQRLQQRRGELQTRLSAFPADLPSQLAEAEARQQQLAEIRATLPWLRQVQARGASLRNEQAAEIDRAGQLDLQERALGELSAEIEQEEEKLERERTRERDLLGGRSAAEEALRLAAERQTRFDQAAQATACEVCGQSIGPEHAERERGRLQRTLEEAQTRFAASQAAVRTCEADRRQLAEALRQRQSALQELRQQRERRVAEQGEARRRQEALLHELRAAAEHLPERFRSLAGEAESDGGAGAAEALAALQAKASGEAEQARSVAALRERIEDQRRCAAALQRDEEDLASVLGDRPEAEFLASVRQEDESAERRSRLNEQRDILEEQLKDLRRQLATLRAEAAEGARAAANLEGRLLSGRAGLKAREDERTSTLSLLPENWRREVRREELVALGGEARRLEPYEALQRDLEEAEKNDVREQVADLDRRLAETPSPARRPEAYMAREQAIIEARLAEDRSALRSRQDALQALDRRNQEHAELLQRRDAVAEEHVLHGRLAHALGPKGLQRWLLQQAERGIVDQANEMLHDLSGGALWLKLQPDEESKKALDLLVCNQETSDRPMPIAMCSGSQRFRIAISLALSTGRYLSREARRVESVIIDEGFGCLDRERRADMVEALKSLRDKLARIILVSHQEEFTGSFTQGYRVELRDRSSVVLPLGDL